MSQRYPVLVGVIGLSLGAVVGGSMRLTDTERRVAGPLSEAAKRRVLEAVDEGYDEVRSSAERVAEQLKAGLGETSAREDQSADFETVLGGGPPPAGGQGVGAPASSGGSRPAAAPAKDMSADFETVLGGGPPPVEERQATSASPSAGSPAGTAGNARLRPGGSSSF